MAFLLIIYIIGQSVYDILAFQLSHFPIIIIHIMLTTQKKIKMIRINLIPNFNSYRVYIQKLFSAWISVVRHAFQLNEGRQLVHTMFFQTAFDDNSEVPTR